MARKAKLIAREPFDAEATIDPTPEQRQTRSIRIREVKATLISPQQRIAESDFCQRNYTIHAFKKEIPDSKHWTIDEYYPYAKGGPLFFDTPKTPGDKHSCEQKRKIMKGLKLRYAIIEAEMDEHSIAAQIGK